MGFTYGWRDRAARSGAADGAPDAQEHDGADGGDDQIAPEIRHHFEMQFLEQKAADNGADQADGKIVKQSAGAAEDLLGEPPGDETDNNPTENTHDSVSSSRVYQHGVTSPAMAMMATYSKHAHKHRAQLPSSSPTTSDAGR